MFNLVSVGRLIPLEMSPTNVLSSANLMMNYDVVVVSLGAVMRVKSEQQGAQHAALWSDCADAEGLRCSMAHSHPYDCEQLGSC